MALEASSVRAGSSMAEAVSVGTRGEYQPATGASTEWKFRPISGISKSNRIKPGTQLISSSDACCTEREIRVRKLPLSGVEKHPNFQVTLCLRFVSTDVKFDD